MELDKSLFFKIKNIHCEFKTLNDSNVSKEYVDGLNHQTKYIMNIPKNVSISSQRKYINNILLSERDTICGLFIDGKLVGTSGIQSSISFLKYIEVPTEDVSTIGIFIFNNRFRGMGLGKIMVWATAYLFHYCTKKEWFGAGMEKENIRSLKSFLSCGFVQVDEDKANYKVLLKLSELIKPEFISEISIHEAGLFIKDSNETN